MAISFSILSPEYEPEPSPVIQIRKNLDALLDLIVQQEEDLREARLMLKRANTEVMLYGKAPPPDYAASLGGDFESAQFLVVALELEKREQLFDPDQNGRFPVREIELMKSAIYRIFETALNQLCIATCCESDQVFANILVNLVDEEIDSGQLEQQFQAAIGNAIALVSRSYGIDLIAEMSSVVYGYENLPAARLEAYERLRINYGLEPLAHTNTVFSAERVRTPPQEADNPLEKLFYQQVLSRNLEQARHTLQELTQQDLDAEDVPLSHARLRFVSRVESMLNMLGLSADNRDYLYLRPADSGEELLAMLQELFDDISGSLEGAGQSQNSRIDEVAAWIEENYSDCNLCLAKLCDLFQMSQSYLSHSFKQLKGVNVLDYIHQQRLIHVRDMLKNTTASIDTIWEQNGYTNRRTFNRIFRKYEGMSASEYRKSAAP